MMAYKQFTENSKSLCLGDQFAPPEENISLLILLSESRFVRLVVHTESFVVELKQEMYHWMYLLHTIK